MNIRIHRHMTAMKNMDFFSSIILCDRITSEPRMTALMFSLDNSTVSITYNVRLERAFFRLLLYTKRLQTSQVKVSSVLEQTAEVLLESSVKPFLFQIFLFLNSSSSILQLWHTTHLVFHEMYASFLYYKTFSFHFLKNWHMILAIFSLSERSPILVLW